MCTDDTQRQCETETPTTGQERQNLVFDGLWHQAASGNVGRRVDCAINMQGKRALKFRTRGFHKALIVEANRRPGFIIRLCGFAHKPGLIDSDGVATFVNPIETEILKTLLNQIDCWVSSFETLYGETGTATVAQQGEPRDETITTNCEGRGAAEHEDISAAGEGTTDGMASHETASPDDRNHVGGSAVSHDNLEWGGL